MRLGTIIVKQAVSFNQKILISRKLNFYIENILGKMRGIIGTMNVNPSWNSILKPPTELNAPNNSISLQLPYWQNPNPYYSFLFEPI
jgi:hypothetical protein